jgi:hypothetical protein
VRSAKEDPSEENLQALRETIMTAEGALQGAVVAEPGDAVGVEAGEGTPAED